ncbi:MAG: 4-hydroxy-tetrahydrodipicolinate reductase [Alphaproteobacteria bacterium]|nr:4-hydroxy-tetrahydrodipicolinate reductase [Alphaproteobacteria bacterium]MBT5160889.1 4-hydroxy-tetrahydrodipicolinate reductase [Alphaproteobacteria bacterium]MBT5918166.1 4-hydroxy-tetrahydrodipicolinate reductase [Alphaproteobacteria bacterium]
MKIAVVGCAGRMGINLLRQIAATEGCVIAGGTERSGSDALGKDLGALAGLDDVGIMVSDDASVVIASVDAILDFTVPAATAEHANLCAEHGTAHIIGTTGLDADHEAAVAAACEKTAVIRGANMSVGVNLLLGLTRKVAAMLDPDWDIEVVEMHHRHKVDAPSGTALALGKAAAEGRGVDHDTVADRGRDGITGERKRGDIGYATLRGGNVVGDHTVVFAADDERIEITHKAADRTIFARGAVTAALWSKGKGPGLYGMDDVLDLT